jgi:hypothetical protein
MKFRLLSSWVSLLLLLFCPVMVSGVPGVWVLVLLSPVAFLLF